jgi:WD40 repeat protein
MPVTEIKAHADLVYSLALSPDGKTLATAGFDNLVKLWDLAERKELRALAGHGGPVYGVAFAPDGKSLASCGDDRTVRLWNSADGKQMKSIQAHGGIADAVAFSPDSRLIASCGADKAVKLWEATSGNAVKTLGNHGGTAYAVAFAADGKLLASAGADGFVKVWDVPGQKEAKSIKAHEGQASAVRFTADGLASVGFDRTLKLWDPAAGNEKHKLGLPDDPYAIGVSPNGKRVAVAGYAGNVTVWEWGKDKPAFAVKHPSPAYCVTFTSDGSSLVSGHGDGVVRITTLASVGA